MKSSYEISQEISEINRKRQEAAQAEAERLRQERANITAQEQASARIQQLEKEKAEAAFYEAQERNGEFNMRQSDLNKKLMAAFEKALKTVPELQEAYEAAKENWTAQEQHVNDTLYHWHQAQSNDLWAGVDMQDVGAVRQAQNRQSQLAINANRKARELPISNHPADVLMETIGKRVGQAQDHAAGIAAAVLKDYVKPGPDFSAEAATNARASAARRGRS